MPYTVTVVKEEALAIRKGKKVLRDEPLTCRATCTTPKWELLKAEEPLAYDVEFQEHKGADAEKWGHRMGRLVVVNTRGETLYDTYVHCEAVPGVRTQMPPARYGVTRGDVDMRNGAKESREVEWNLRKLFQDRMVVGHGVRLDQIAVGNVWEENHKRWDSQGHYGQIGLTRLVDAHLGHLGMDFNYHDPVDDARATMLLYLQLHPYKGRNTFEDPIPKYNDSEEFPPLGSKPCKKN